MPAVLHRAATPAGLSLHGGTSEQLSKPRRMLRFCGMDRPRRDPTASSRAECSPATWLSSRRSPRCFRCPPAARMLFPQYPARPWSSPELPVRLLRSAPSSFLFSARSRASSRGTPRFFRLTRRRRQRPRRLLLSPLLRMRSRRAIPPSCPCHGGLVGKGHRHCPERPVLPCSAPKELHVAYLIHLTERARWFHPARMMATLVSRPRIRI